MSVAADIPPRPRPQLRVVGGGKVDYREPAGDPGLFGPDSMAWRVHANPIALAIGGVAAVILELAEPYEVTVQAVSKHVKVLEDAGLVCRTTSGHRAPVRLEAEVFDLMTKWIERYRRVAEERYQRLDALLATLPDDEPITRQED